MCLCVCVCVHACPHGNNDSSVTHAGCLPLIYRAAMMEGSGTLEEQLEATKVCISD